MIATTADPSFLEQIGPTLVAVVLTGIVGVVAAWVGRRWERHATRDAWLREKRLAVYADFVEKLQRALDEVRIAGPSLDDLDDEELSERLRPYAEADDELGRSSAVIMILGTPEMLALAHECMTAVERVFDERNASPDRDLASEEAMDALTEAWALRRRFADAARVLLTS